MINKAQNSQVGRLISPYHFVLSLLPLFVPTRLAAPAGCYQAFAVATLNQPRVNNRLNEHEVRHRRFGLPQEI